MKKKLITTLMAGALSASMVMPAFATQNGAVPVEDGTEVWAGVIINDQDARVMVEVPTLFAFVVNGSVDANANQPTVADGTILLPNALVKVNAASSIWVDDDNEPSTPDILVPNVDGNGDALTNYTLQYRGDGNMPFTNYSTYIPDPDLAPGVRDGLEVSINGNLANEGTEYSRNYWTHTNSSLTTDARTNFKNYNISIDGAAFDTPANGGLEMAAAIDLVAPDLSNNNLDPVTNLAIIGTTHFANFEVSVGGQRDQYNQIEESAKVGTIVWTIDTNITVDETHKTAPNEDFLQ